MKKHFLTLGLVGLISLSTSLSGSSFNKSMNDVNTLQHSLTSKYDVNGKLLVQNLSNDEKYFVGSDIFKRYYQEEPKFVDIDKNYLNFYHIENNNPDLVPAVYASITKKIQSLKTKDEIVTFQKELNLFLYRIKSIKIGKILNNVISTDVSLTKKLDLNSFKLGKGTLMGVKSNVLQKIIKDPNLINVVNLNFLSNDSLVEAFKNASIDIRKIDNMSLEIQKLYLKLNKPLFNNVKKGFISNDVLAKIKDIKYILENENNELGFETDVINAILAQIDLFKEKHSFQIELNKISLPVEDDFENYKHLEILAFYNKNYSKMKLFNDKICKFSKENKNIQLFGDNKCFDSESEFQRGYSTSIINAFNSSFEKYQKALHSKARTFPRKELMKFFLEFVNKKSTINFCQFEEAVKFKKIKDSTDYCMEKIQNEKTKIMKDINSM